MEILETCLSVGIFDSGIGGLTVFKAIREILPSQPLIYFADQAHVPYGSRSLDEVKDFSMEITRFLLEKKAGLIVVACNTASAAALQPLREKFPQIPFVGMEPAVKPAAQNTASGKVGVLATPATFQGKLYASVVERFAKGTVIFQSTCPGLVQQIEAGNLEGDVTRSILEEALRPMLAEGVDSIVLGCTHYPFVRRSILDICGAGITVIDPAMPVARQVMRILGGLNQNCTDTASGEIRFYTSGDAEKLEKALPLIGENGIVNSLRWEKGRLW